MAEIVLFHHALGLTDGVLSFADRIRERRHVVHTPDLYGGRTFSSLIDGVAHADAIGFQTVIDQGIREAEAFSDEVFYAGMSLGLLPAQKLAQTRSGAKGALLVHGCVPASEFGDWPPSLPAQIHVMSDDEWGDVDIARALASSVPTVELFEYPGNRHLFTDESTDDFDPEAAALAMQRILDFLDRP